MHLTYFTKARQAFPSAKKGSTEVCNKVQITVNHQEIHYHDLGVPQEIAMSYHFPFRYKSGVQSVISKG